MTSVARIVLFACWLAFMFFAIKYVFTCLPYFSSDFVLCLMIVCRQIAHIYVFACCRIFGDATSSCVAVFAVGCSFFLRPRLLHCDIYACCNLFCSIYCNFSVFFLQSLSACFFCNFLHWVTQFALARFTVLCISFVNYVSNNL